MTARQSHTKKRSVKQTTAEKKALVAAANRRAQLQWYAVGFGLVSTVVAAIVLISIFTDGELPVYGHGG